MTVYEIRLHLIKNAISTIICGTENIIILTVVKGIMFFTPA